MQLSLLNRPRKRAEQPGRLRDLTLFCIEDGCQLQVDAVKKLDESVLWALWGVAEHGEATVLQM
jgi:hypothetical protein